MADNEFVHTFKGFLIFRLNEISIYINLVQISNFPDHLQKVIQFFFFQINHPHNKCLLNLSKYRESLDLGQCP